MPPRQHAEQNLVINTCDNDMIRKSCDVPKARTQKPPYGNVVALLVEETHNNNKQLRVPR